MKAMKIPCFFILFLVLTPCLPLHAEPEEYIPYVSVRQEYSDNIFFSSTNERDDFITTGTAGLLYDYRAEQVKARLDGRLDRLLYQDNSGLDDTEGRAFASLDYQATERMTLGGSAEFRKDSRRDWDRTDTGILVSGDREKTNLKTSSSYMFSEITKGEASFGYSRTQLDDPDEKEDNDTFRMDFALTRNLSEIFKNTTGLFNFSYMHYTSDQEDYGVPFLGLTTVTRVQDYTSDIFQAYAGFSRQINELFSYYVQLGASYTESVEGSKYKNPLNGAESRRTETSDSSLGGVLVSGLNYSGLYTDVGISLSRDVRGGTGTNGTVERSALSIEISRKISDGFTLTLDTSVYLNTNERQNRADLDELTFHFQPGFRYRFWDTWTLAGGYRYTSEDDREQNITTERNLIYFSIRKNFEL